MMGALSGRRARSSWTHLEAMLKAFFPESKHKFIPLNIRAIEAGRAAV